MASEVGEEAFLVLDMMRHFDSENQIERCGEALGKWLRAVVMPYLRAASGAI